MLAGDTLLQQVNEKRRKTKAISIGNVPIGGDSPISVQSMTKCETSDRGAVLDQIRSLATAGCDIIRLAIPDESSARAIERICKASPIPVVADIHFDYQLALITIAGGVDAVRINPGNMKRESHVKAVADAAQKAGIPIRIGINSGSLERSLLKKYGGPTAEAMAESAMMCAKKFEGWGFKDLKLSLKSHDVAETVFAYRKVAAVCDYPLHLGITATGAGLEAKLKSAVGIGALLIDGIGDTIRVSLSSEPEEEVVVGLALLKTLGLHPRGLELVACPTCGRCKVDLLNYLEIVKKGLSGIQGEISVAVMGCVVNGPGEARQADIGVAFSDDGTASVFRDGRHYASGPAGEMLERLIDDARRLAEERRTQ
ncbi:MAG: flavodoxin-dependent (E)-4-hydroxy-3-methylbut-2-enyl-diphosphate synthase [Candidatus Coatesbacteria bacterium]|nr:flavodoxin-dependent (E)-4-hydroxy-3-methylbut-2-enyl-diphosphate synthase [Candidatus Coatesbacteria bacterium]